MDLDHFFKDFKIPTQDEDSSVDFANPSDAARSLIKARNWSGNLVEEFIKQRQELDKLKKDLTFVKSKLSKIERNVISRQDKIPTWAVKNYDTQKVFVWKFLTQSEKDEYIILEEEAQLIEQVIVTYNSNLEKLESIRRILEKSTDWVVQYLNWVKHELRSLNG